MVTLPSAVEAAEVKAWIEDPARLEYLRGVFSTTTRFGQLQGVAATVAGRNVYLRFKCSTGDAMGMNVCARDPRWFSWLFQITHSAVLPCARPFPSSFLFSGLDGDEHLAICREGST